MTLTIEQPNRRVSVLQDGRNLTLAPVERRAVFERAGVQGPAGADGAGSDVDDGETHDADGAVGGHRVVARTALGVRHAVAGTLGDAQKIYGITLGAADDGDEVQVVTRGVMEEGSWSWTTGGALFFTGAGVLTQAPPTSVYSVTVGVALSPTVIFVSIGEAVIL